MTVSPVTPLTRPPARRAPAKPANPGRHGLAYAVLAPQIIAGTLATRPPDPAITRVPRSRPTLAEIGTVVAGLTRRYARPTLRVLSYVLALALVVGTAAAVVWLAVLAIEALIGFVTAAVTAVAAFVTWVVSVLATLALVAAGVFLAALLLGGPSCPGLHCGGCRRH